MDEKAFLLMSYAGMIKAQAYEAFDLALTGQFEEARESINGADETLSEVSTIQKEILNEDKELTLMMVHAQDHVMTAVEARNLLEKMIDLMEGINHDG